MDSRALWVFHNYAKDQEGAEPQILQSDWKGPKLVWKDIQALIARDSQLPAQGPLPPLTCSGYSEAPEIILFCSRQPNEISSSITVNYLACLLAPSKSSVLYF